MKYNRESRLNEMLRSKDMTRKFLNLALRAASHPGSILLVNNRLDILSKQVEEEINAMQVLIQLSDHCSQKQDTE
jgi:hypothetical protein